MWAAVDWANLNTAGAFIVGAVLGSIGTLRVMRYVMGAARAQRRLPTPGDDGER